MKLTKRIHLGLNKEASQILKDLVREHGVSKEEIIKKGLILLDYITREAIVSNAPVNGNYYCLIKYDPKTKKILVG